MLPLSFQDISKHFDKTIAVDHLSLDARAGELFFLLGPSGCGKTTCLRMVAGFLQPDSGTLLFGDKPMNNVPPHKRNTGMVFQNYALWPHMTAAENIAYGLRVRKTPKTERENRVLDALKMVRLEDRAQHYPNQLSGGQQQRVALARALVINPDVLLLDEPLSNLDAQLRLEMRGEIKRLHTEKQTTALYVTHDQDEALSIADRIGVMRNGLLIQVGTPRELYRTPQSRFVAEFIGETNFLEGRVQSSGNGKTIVETPVGLIVAAQQSSLQAGQNVWCSIRPESWQIESESSTRNAENQLAAQVQSVSYGGATEQLQLRLTGGIQTTQNEDWRLLKVAVLNPLHSRPAGENVALSCRAEDVVVLAE
jgi:iron(III) transport system ATP-binding protein